MYGEVKFNVFQGIHPSLIEFEVMKTLRDIDLTEKANASAKHLSGGQKRKLSIGIAVIGDPKVIFIKLLLLYDLKFW